MQGGQTEKILNALNISMLFNRIHAFFIDIEGTQFYSVLDLTERNVSMKKHTLLSLAVSAILFAGCGGGGNPGDPDGSSGESDGGTGDTAEFTCNPAPFTIGDAKYRYNIGTEGDIHVNCNGLFSSNRYTLANGMSSMNVNRVKKVAEADMKCDDGSAKGSITYDYNAGTVTYSGVYNGKSLTCTDHYETRLPTTIADSDSIADLLDEWGDDRSSQEFLRTNCPREVEESDDAETNCRGTYEENIRITDNTGKVNIVTKKVTVTAP